MPFIWLAFLALGIAARCRQYVGCPSYWYDEAYLLLNIFEKSYTDLIGPLQYHVVIPPLFLWILRGLYVLAGPSEWAMRAPALAAGLAVLLLMIPLARRICGSPGWLWAAGFCALSDHALMHSCEVRPYSCDILLTEAVLFTTYSFLATSLSPRSQSWGYGGLLALALLAPWISFPSVFALGGASLAILVGAFQRRVRALWVRWLVFNALFFASALALWYFVGRHLYYPGLGEHWTQGWNGFPDTSSPRCGWALKWAMRCVIDLGNYGTTGMGIPLVLLGTLGIVMLWRRSPPLAVLLVSPAVLGGLAAFLHRYPLGDRTAFFIVPCLWLLAAGGIGTLVNRMHGRFAWLGLALLAALLMPGAVVMTKSFFRVQPKAQFREAFTYVREHWSAGDRLWVSHPEVYEVYYGRDATLLGYYTPPEVVANVARSGRLWTVCVPQEGDNITFPEVFKSLRAVQSVPIMRHRVKGLEVVLFAPMSSRRAE